MANPRAYMSFGGGVQSTAIAMLAINRDERLLRATDGVLPELYIFADTGDEPKALYPHIEDMKARIEASGARFAVVQTPLGNLGDYTRHIMLEGHRSAEMLPVWVDKGGQLGPVRRTCTAHFKIRPINTRARAHFGVLRGQPHGGGKVKLWLGISCDERQREKVGPVPKQEWCEYFNPLIAMNWHRADAANYLEGLGIRPIRSACVYCPFHSMAEWRELSQSGEDWARAVEIDESLVGAHERGACGFKSEMFLTQQGVRLRDLDLTEPDDPQRKLWDNECAGVCGV